MNEHEFLAAVQQRTDAESSQEAYVLADAALQALSDRIVQGEAENIAAQLPRQIGDSLTSGPPEAQEFPVDEFVDQIETREGDLGPINAPTVAPRPGRPRDAWRGGQRRRRQLPAVAAGRPDASLRSARDTRPRSRASLRSFGPAVR